MNRDEFQEVLEAVAAGQLGVDDAIDRLRAQGVEDLGFARLVRYHSAGRILEARPDSEPMGPLVGVVSAGTSDLPVAEEAAVVLEHLGHRVDRVNDIGVAGIHRLFSVLERLRAATALVVVAGMEGALPSVVAGLVESPVVAVPTSVGYGASFGGVAALLGMLNSCATGIGVVNIDNGFGAATLVHRMTRAGGGSAL
ncbi:MAG: nickel pincer cofactor biosynthesis protein LarB [Acidobacteria bacterium]|nr:nickel pincer cofactor biosynthesis protein LarB [Candidatus Sulfomarinibacter kjeldsenii]